MQSTSNQEDVIQGKVSQRIVLQMTYLEHSY